ncbi:MAG: electron transfer flavoprotein subunit beta/FixA family protein [Saprospiraceae bacterium]|nr:electron transfer flavoprotein subunit beta/FixA family protein [Candidatus Vicinibacter affinis]
MNLLVCISKTPDTTSKISFDATGTRLIEEGVQFIMNPYDEWYALVRALELKEKFGGQVHVVHVGTSNSEMIMRKALAIGADAAFRVDKEPLDSMDTANQLAAFAKTKNYDIVFLGKETIDHNGSEMGAMLAALLNLPFISYANHLELDGTKAILDVEIEGGIEVLEVNVPFVISAAKGMAEQRIPNMKGIMDAKKKPLEVIEAIPSIQKVGISRFEQPPVKTSVRMIDPSNIDELVTVLKEDLKII